MPLDAIGRAQAAALAAALRDESLDAAVSSDLARARETAAAVLAGRDLPLVLDARWREMGFGAWEGLTWDEIAARFPESAGRPNEGGRFVTPTGGESFEALCERVLSAVRDLGARLPGRRVLVGTHAGPLHALLHVLLGQQDAAALGVRFEPASITRIRLRGSAATILTLNETVTSVEEDAFAGRSASAAPQNGGRG